jgi:hypothetical protein
MNVREITLSFCDGPPKKRILYIYLPGKVFLKIGLNRYYIAKHSRLIFIRIFQLWYFPLPSQYESPV